MGRSAQFTAVLTDGVVGVLTVLWMVPGTIWQVGARAWQRQLDREHLEGLDHATLEDIGIRRQDIGEAVRKGYVRKR